MIALDLFCGCGGASLGFRQASEGKGPVTLIGIDIDRWAITTYSYNRLGHAIRADVRYLPLRVFPLDIIIACPPCPAFSYATLRRSKRHEVEKQLVVVAGKVIGQFLPRAFLFENVPGILRFAKIMRYFFAHMGVEFDEEEWERVRKESVKPCNRVTGAEVRARRNMTGAYSVAWGILDAVNYGVPQRRKRLIVIGVRIDEVAVLSCRSS